ncbi:MAG TPA: thioesterase family protein [Trichocoleus sp.]
MFHANAIALENPFAVELSFKLQPFDLDSYGFASEFAYLRWLGSLRQEFLQQHFDLAQGTCPVLVSTQIEHKQPVRSSEPGLGPLSSVVSGRLWLANLGETRWTLQSRLESTQGVTVATAVQVGHMINADTLMPVAIPEALAQRYWDYQWRQSS